MIRLIIIFLLSAFALPTLAIAQPTTTQSIKDPLSDYCQSILYSPEIKEVYVFQGQFTSSGEKSIFITDDASASGMGRYEWSAYYPQGSLGLYLRAGDSIQCGLLGPDYIGYVAEFKRYGILNAGRNGIHFQYLDNGAIKNGWLGKNGTVSGGKGYEDLRGYDESTNAYPNYFNNSNRVQVTQYTLSQLRAKYGSQ